MAEDQNLSPWRKKFLANRMTFESILFERELVTPKPEKKHSGLLILLALFLFHSLLLTQAVLRGGGNLVSEDAATVETAYQYAKAVDAGNYSQLLKPESFGLMGFKAPLYYLSFYAPLKLFPANPALALAAVNSFYLLLIMLALYFAVRKGRNAPSGWFAASLAASFPVIIQLGRHASPDLAIMALVAGAYCCYINSEDFVSMKWSVLFGLCFSLGLMADTRFIIYVLPLVPFAINAFLNPLTRQNIKYFYLLLLLPAPWYLRNFAFSFFRDLFVHNDLREAVGIGSINLLNLLHDLPLLVDAMHLPLFALCVVSLVWFCLSVFMAYDDKELVAVWFLLPYAVFSLFSRAGGGNIYPAVLPFALAAGIMMPNVVRKPLIGLTLLLAVLYQSGFVPAMAVTLYGKPAGVFGMDLVRARDLRTEDALKAINAAAGGRAVRVQLVGDDAYFNRESLGLVARKLGYPAMTFVSYPKDYMGLADFVAYKTAGFSMPYSSGVLKAYSDEISSTGGWFPSVFSQLDSFELADTSRLVVYAKSQAGPARLEAGTYTFPSFSVGPVTFTDAIVDVGPYDAAAGTYDFWEIFIPHFRFNGADLFSLRFRLRGLALVPLTENFSDVRLTGCETVRILSLKLREETLGRLLQAGSPYFQNLRVEFDNGLSILGDYHGFGVNLGFSVAPTGAGFKLKLTRLYLGRLWLDMSGGANGLREDPTEEEEVPPAKQAAAAVNPHDLVEVRKALAQYAGDNVVGDAMKLAGHGKLLEEAAKTAEQPKPKIKRASPAAVAQAADGGAPPSLLARLFSMDFDLLNEKTVPFKVEVSRLYFKNGLLTIR